MRGTQLMGQLLVPSDPTDEHEHIGERTPQSVEGLG
jgi:hypothetical protein